MKKTDLGETLKLIPLQIEHAEAMNALLKARSIVDQLASVHFPYTIENAKKWIQKCQAFDAEAGRISQWAIMYQGQFVGEIGFHSFNPNRKTQSALGFWVGIPFQNQGIATEAVRRVTQIGFQLFGYKLIKAAVFHGNIASKKTLEKCGYRFQRMQKDYLEKEGQPIDCWLFERSI
ncbi:MAG: GNAT family N-acetyltransferase [Bdellovibrionales bacterium]|nr:GNAT family N-acetyltransferase [Bdellovibrionales bacterium]